MFWWPWTYDYCVCGKLIDSYVATHCYDEEESDSDETMLENERLIQLDEETNSTQVEPPETPRSDHRGVLLPLLLESNVTYDGPGREPYLHVM